jgi:hypothetical protein
MVTSGEMSVENGIVFRNGSTEKGIIYHGDTENTEKIMVVHGEKISEPPTFFLLRVLCASVVKLFSGDPQK